MPTASSRTWCTLSTTEPAHTIPHLAMVVVQYLLWNGSFARFAFCSFRPVGNQPLQAVTGWGGGIIRRQAKQEANAWRSKWRVAAPVAEDTTTPGGGGRPAPFLPGQGYPGTRQFLYLKKKKTIIVIRQKANKSKNNNNNSPGHPDPKPKGLGLHVFRSPPSDALAVYFRMLSLDDCKIQMILSSHNIVILRSLTNIN